MMISLEIHPCIGFPFFSVLLFPVAHTSSLGSRPKILVHKSLPQALNLVKLRFILFFFFIFFSPSARVRVCVKHKLIQLIDFKTLE